MPELAHEYPTSEELQAYLHEHLDRSMFSDWSKATDGAAVSIVRQNGQVFSARAYEALLTGLSRLNELPRTNPFWRNTNNRPTIYKLGEFCQMKLADAPEDKDRALRTASILQRWS
jgi:hypothetical protein